MLEIPTTEQSIIQVQLILVKFYFGNVPFVKSKTLGLNNKYLIVKVYKIIQIELLHKKFTGEMEKSFQTKNLV